MNPASVSRRCVAPNTNTATKMFKIYPVTTTGSVTVSYRTMPSAFTTTDTVPFDKDYLVQAACAAYAASDDLGTAEVQKFLMEARRIKQILKDNELNIERTNERLQSPQALTEWT